MGTPAITPQINTPPPGVVFDDAPITATSTPPPGVVFDTDPVPSAPSTADTTNPTTNDPSQPQQTSTPATTGFPMGKVSALPDAPTMSGKMERWARNLNEDLRYGTDLTGIGTVLKKMGAHGLGDNPVGNFMGSVPLGLAKALIGASELPQTGKRWQGTKDTIGGALDTATIPSMFVSPGAGELAGEAGDAILSQAENAAKAVGTAAHNTFSVDSIQQPLKDGLRNVFNTVAKDAGVQPSQASSIRDVAAELGEAVKAKASSLYAQLDKATGGGRFQRFSDALSNIDNAMKDALGVDPEKYEALVERRAEVEQAQKAALDAARAAGVDPALITKANAAWRQQAALSELGNSIRQTVQGMRPELANAESSVEKLNPKVLFTKINRLYDKGRLADAIGQDNAKALLQHVDSAYLAAQKIANRNAWIKRGATAIGLGGAGGLGYEAVSGLHHLLGGPE